VPGNGLRNEPPATAATQGESLLKKLKNFAVDLGAEEFENFREQMDRLFDPRKNGTAVEGPGNPDQCSIKCSIKCRGPVPT
jgi:hypothetical protein